MLGVVPSLVKTWRNADCVDGLDWTQSRPSVRRAKSNPDDALSDVPRRIPTDTQYCGGTEIGGGYITGTLVQPSAPSTFTMAALGLDFTILDEHGAACDNGELFLIPPSLGLSNELLNRDHFDVYFADCADPW